MAAFIAKLELQIYVLEFQQLESLCWKFHDPSTNTGKDISFESCTPLHLRVCEGENNNDKFGKN